MFRIARSKLIQTISSIRSVIIIYLSVHVRWPARPAELWAGLDFSFVSFLCIKTKKRKSFWILTKSEETDSTYKRKVYILSFACAKESNKEKHTGNDIQPLPEAVIKLLYYC